MLSIRYFTTLQVLVDFPAAPPLVVAFVGALTLIDVEAFFTTSSFPEFVVAAFALYFVGLVMPFASLFWVMTIKLIWEVTSMGTT